MRVRGEVKVEVGLEDERACKVVKGSLEPDERDLPKGISSEITCKDSTLTYRITFELEAERLLSLAATIDDFIRNLKVALSSSFIG